MVLNYFAPIEKKNKRNDKNVCHLNFVSTAITEKRRKQRSLICFFFVFLFDYRRLYCIACVSGVGLLHNFADRQPTKYGKSDSKYTPLAMHLFTTLFFAVFMMLVVYYLIYITYLPTLCIHIPISRWWKRFNN